MTNELKKHTDNIWRNPTPIKRMRKAGANITERTRLVMGFYKWKHNRPLAEYDGRLIHRIHVENDKMCKYSKVYSRAKIEAEKITIDRIFPNYTKNT